MSQETASFVRFADSGPTPGDAVPATAWARSTPGNRVFTCLLDRPELCRKRKSQDRWRSPGLLEHETPTIQYQATRRSFSSQTGYWSNRRAVNRNDSCPVDICPRKPGISLCPSPPFLAITFCIIPPGRQLWMVSRDDRLIIVGSDSDPVHAHTKTPCVALAGDHLFGRDTKSGHERNKFNAGRNREYITRVPIGHRPDHQTIGKKMDIRFLHRGYFGIG